MADISLLNKIGLLTAQQEFLKSQLFELFEIIKSKNMNPADFVWQSMPGPPGEWHQGQPRLIHSPSKFYCDFYFHNDGKTRAMKYTPGLTSHFENPGALNWDGQRQNIALWLDNLKREIEAPDVWDMSYQEREALASSPSADSDNSPFTAEEKEKVFAKLEEIRQYLLTAHRLDPELVEARLQYLVGAVDRLGRVDWKGVVISTIIGLLTEAAASPDAFRDVIGFVGGVLRDIYKTAPQLLGN